MVFRSSHQKKLTKLSGSTLAKKKKTKKNESNNNNECSFMCINDHGSNVYFGAKFRSLGYVATEIGLIL